MHRVSVDGHVRVAVRAGEGLAERDGHVDQPGGNRVVRGDGKLNFVAAYVLFPRDDHVGGADGDVRLVLVDQTELGVGEGEGEAGVVGGGVGDVEVNLRAAASGTHEDRSEAAVGEPGGAGARLGARVDLPIRGV